MQNSRQHSFISDLWTTCLRPNHFREKVFVGYNQNRLGRGLCDFEWSNNPNAHIGQIPLRDKYRLRSIMQKGSLLLHVMLTQGMCWYPLDNVEYLLPPPHLEESEI